MSTLICYDYTDDGQSDYILSNAGRSETAILSSLKPWGRKVVPVSWGRYLGLAEPPPELSLIHSNKKCIVNIWVAL